MACVNVASYPGHVASVNAACPVCVTILVLVVNSDLFQILQSYAFLL